MRIKNFMAILLTLTLVFGSTMVFSATEEIALSSTEKLGELDENCVELQLERLMELFRGDFIVPFSADGEPVNAPSINMIMPPGECCSKYR